MEKFLDSLIADFEAGRITRQGYGKHLFEGAETWISPDPARKVVVGPPHLVASAPFPAFPSGSKMRA